MSLSDELHRSDSRLEVARQLLSRLHDGDLTDDELKQFAELQVEYREELAAEKDRLNRLTAALGALPVTHLPHLLVSGRALATGDQLPSGRTELKRSGSGWHRLSRMGGALVTVGLSLCLMFAILRLRPAFLEDSEIPSVAARTGVQGDAPAGGEMPAELAADATAANEPIADEAELNVAANSPPLERALASGADTLPPQPADVTVRVGSSEPDGSPAAVSVRSFLEASDWTIVVLNVTQADRGLAREQIRDFLHQHGIDISPPEAEPAGLEWMGVVLGSEGREETGRLFQDAVAQGVAESPEWDPNRIASASRDELIAAVRASLQFPTKSELHHGELYVAIPSAERLPSGDAGVSVASSEQAPARKLATDPQAGAVSETTTGEETPGVTSGEAKIVSGRPVLVVFKFASEEQVRKRGLPDGRI